MSRPSLSPVLIAALLLVVLVPTPALAYGGPGSIVSGIGTLLAVLTAIVAAAVGFVWFPLKRLYARLFGRGSGDGEEPRDA